MGRPPPPLGRAPPKLGLAAERSRGAQEAAREIVGLGDQGTELDQLLEAIARREPGLVTTDLLIELLQHDQGALRAGALRARGEGRRGDSSCLLTDTCYLLLPTGVGKDGQRVLKIGDQPKIATAA